MDQTSFGNAGKPGVPIDFSQNVVTGLAGGMIGGASTQVQFNNGGAFAGDSAFIYNSSTKTLFLGVSGASTGKLTLRTALGTKSFTLQSGDNPTSSQIVKWPEDDPVAGDTLRVTSFTGGVVTLNWGV